MPGPLSEDAQNLIKGLYLIKRMKSKQIAEIVGCRDKTVQQWIRRLGIKRTDEVYGPKGMVYKRLSPETEQAICDAARDGVIPSEIATSFNMTIPRVRSVLARHNVKGPTQTLGYRYDRVFSPDEDQEIRRRVEAGESKRSIAREYGVSGDNIRAACTRAGMPTGLSAKAQQLRNKACERIAVRSTLSIEQTAQLLDCPESLVRRARIRHAKNPTVISPPDEDEQKILGRLNAEPHVMRGLYGGDPVHKRPGRPPGKRPVIVSDPPTVVQSEIIRLRKEGKLVNEIAAILQIDTTEVRAALQSKWSR